MKVIILVTLFLGLALATSPTPPDEPIAIVKSAMESNPDGSYSYSFESADGTIREETGIVKNAGTDEAYIAQVGSYKYVDADGKPVEVHYEADENGFVPEGTNIHDSISAAAKAGGKP